MERVTYSLGVDPKLKTPKALLRGWADVLDTLLENHPQAYTSSSQAAMDQVYEFIDKDMENSREHYTQEGPGMTNHGQMWDLAVQIADQYALNITTYGLELATVGVHDENELRVVLGTMKIVEEMRLLILGAILDPMPCLTANDVARVFNYGIPEENFFKTAWDLQALESKEVELKVQRLGRERVNLLEEVGPDDFRFDLPSDKLIRNKLLETVAEIG